MISYYVLHGPTLNPGSLRSDMVGTMWKGGQVVNVTCVHVDRSGERLDVPGIAHSLPDTPICV